MLHFGSPRKMSLNGWKIKKEGKTERKRKEWQVEMVSEATDKKEQPDNTSLG